MNKRLVNSASIPLRVLFVCVWTLFGFQYGYADSYTYTASAENIKDGTASGTFTAGTTTWSYQAIPYVKNEFRFSQEDIYSPPHFLKIGVDDFPIKQFTLSSSPFQGIVTKVTVYACRNNQAVTAKLNVTVGNTTYIADASTDTQGGVTLGKRYGYNGIPFVFTGASSGEVQISLTQSGKSKSSFGGLYLGTITIEYANNATPETITLNAHGISSYASDKNLDFSNTGLTAYIAHVEGNKVMLTQVNKVKANTGLLIEGQGNQEYTIPTIAETETEDVTSNEFKGVVGQAEKVNKVWVLSIKNNNLGFYRFNGDIPPGRAYLPPTATDNESKNGLIVEFPTPTAIKQALQNTVTNPQRYNLQGQKVDKNYRGIVVVNGKKVLQP